MSEDNEIILRKSVGDTPSDIVEYRLTLETLQETATSMVSYHLRAACFGVLMFETTVRNRKLDPPLSSYKKWPLPSKLSLHGRRAAPEGPAFPPPPYLGDLNLRFVTLA